MRKNTANIKAKMPSFTSSLILPFLNSAIITLFMIYAFKPVSNLYADFFHLERLKATPLLSYFDLVCNF